MIVKRLRLEGRFVEAFPYLDHLWLVGEGGEIYAFDTSRFATERLATEADAAEAVFARNDRLGADTRRIDADSLPAHLVRFLTETGDVDVPESLVERYSTIFDVRLQARSVLDFRCYYRRAYVATEGGIVQLRLLDREAMRHIGLGARGNGRLRGERVHDGKCIQLRSRYGVVSAACGRDGGLYARGAASDERSWVADFRSFAPRSLATEFMGAGLANVPGSGNLEIYETTRGEGAGSRSATSSSGSEDAEEARGSIEGIGERSPDGDALNAFLGAAQDRTGAPFKRLFLTTRGLFAFDAANNTRSFAVALESGLDTTPGGRNLAKAPGDVMGFSTSPCGILIETEAAVHVLNGGRWTTLLDEPVYGARGYPSSKWYRHLVTLVAEQHVDLCFVL